MVFWESVSPGSRPPLPHLGGASLRSAVPLAGTAARHGAGAEAGHSRLRGLGGGAREPAEAPTGPGGCWEEGVRWRRLFLGLFGRAAEERGASAGPAQKSVVPQPA